MNPSRTPDEQRAKSGPCLAILFARGALGLIFFMAGVWKVFELTPVGHAHRYFVDSYADSLLPAW